MTFPLDSPAANFKLNKHFSKFDMVMEEDPGQAHAWISFRKVLISTLGLSCCRARLCTKLPHTLGSSCPSQTEPTSSTSPPQGFLLFIQYQQFIFLFLSRSSFHNHNHIYMYMYRYMYIYLNPRFLFFIFQFVHPTFTLPSGLQCPRHLCLSS